MNDGRLQPVFWQFGAFRQRINLLIQSVIIEKIKVNENASLWLEVFFSLAGMQFSRF